MDTFACFKDEIFAVQPHDLLVTFVNLKLNNLPSYFCIF